MLKLGDALRDDFDDTDGAEDANKGPEDGHDIANIPGLLLAVAEEVGDWVGEVLPGRRRHEAVEETVNVEPPCCWIPA